MCLSKFQSMFIIKHYISVRYTFSTYISSNVSVEFSQCFDIGHTYLYNLAMSQFVFSQSGRCGKHLITNIALLGSIVLMYPRYKLIIFKFSFGFTDEYKHCFGRTQV